jgi:transcriptional regulator of heat shock response
MAKTLTERQSKILNCIAEEYIGSKTPVSSKILAKKYGFGIEPSTMRLEFQRLTEMGYLAQPHTSAGRIPTDKGYRFYVDNLHSSTFDKSWDSIGKEIEDSLGFFQEMTRKIAELTSNLAITYFPEEDVVFKEGWDELFKEPEFEDATFISKFMEAVQSFEKHIDELQGFDNLQVFIGKENKVVQAPEFSTIVSKIHLSKKKDGVLVILGPKRMAYDKNVSIMNSLIKLLQ